MDITSALDWLQSTGLAVLIRDSLFTFPLLEGAHVIGLKSGSDMGVTEVLGLVAAGLAVGIEVSSLQPERRRIDKRSKRAALRVIARSLPGAFAPNLRQRISGRIHI